MHINGSSKKWVIKLPKPSCDVRLSKNEASVLKKLSSIDHDNVIGVYSASSKGLILEKAEHGELFNIISGTEEGLSETSTKVIIHDILKS